MSEQHSTNGRPEPVVAYYRMSDDKQENSIERQRSQVEPYAARHGYAIVREYTDEGIAGDEAEKRPGFMKLIQDAVGSHDFKVILCDDKDRFGRFDGIDFGYYVKPLRDAGVRLETVAQGKIDWCSFAGRLLDMVTQGDFLRSSVQGSVQRWTVHPAATRTANRLSVCACAVAARGPRPPNCPRQRSAAEKVPTQEQKKRELLDNSRRTLSEMLRLAMQGYWLGGRPRYGYVLVPDPTRRSRTGKVGKKLVLDDPKKVAAVVLMFTMYDQGHDPDTIAGTLTRRGILNPSGKEGWNKTTVRDILGSRKYVGDSTWNTGHNGKYSEVRDGTLFTSECRLPPRSVNPQDDWVIVPNTHEPIIKDRDLWERVQARLEASCRHRHAVVPPARRRAYPLGDLLVCGHCGWRMIGTSVRGVKYYKCGKYHRMGKHGCKANLVSEVRLVRGIMAKLEKVLLNPAVLELIRAEFRKQAEELARGTAPRLAKLRKQLATLEPKIEQGVGRMALIPADLLTEYAAKIRGWKEERDRLREEVEGLEKGTNVAEVDRLLETFEADIAHLHDVLDSLDPTRLRRLLLEYISKVELYFDHEEKAKMTRSRFREGRLYVRPQEGLDWSCLLDGAAARAGRSGTGRCATG
jgi:hypothetical protein